MEKKKVLSTVLLSLAGAALIALAVVYGVRHHAQATEDVLTPLDSLVEVLPVSAEDLAQIDLEGTYDLKIASDTLQSSYSAKVKRGIDEGYVITVLSDYDPEMHSFQVNGNRLFSPTFGEGTVSFQELTGRLSLEFRKENSVCTLVKYVK